MAFALKKSRSLYSILVVPFVLQMLLLGTIIGWLSFNTGSNAVDQLLEKRMGSLVESTEQTIKAQLERSDLVTSAITKGLGSYGINLNDQPALEKLFHQITAITPSVNFVYAGNTNGDFIGVDRLRDGRVATHIKNKDTEGKKLVYAISAPGERQTLIPEMSRIYDTLARPWYKLGMEKKQAAWTSVYLSASKNILEVTQAVPLLGSDGQPIGVIGSDLPLTQLSEYLRNHPISENGIAFIMEPSGELIASSSAKEPPYRTEDGKQLRLQARASSESLIKATAEYLLVDGKLPKESKLATYTYSSGNDTVEVSAKALDPVHGLNWITVVAVPRQDFMGQINRNTWRTFVFGLVTLALAIGAGIWALRRITRDLQNLSTAAESFNPDNPQHGELPKSRVVEVARLSGSLSNMTARLRDSMAQISNKNAELARANLSLEQTITQRTDALQQQNDALSSEIEVRKRAEHQLRKLSNVVEQTGDAIMISDDKGLIEYVNPGFERLTGCTLAEIIGKKPSMFNSDRHDQAFYDRIWQIVRSGTAYSGVIVLRKKNGEIYYSQKTITPIPGVNGQPSSYISVEKDVTDRELAREHLQHQLNVDTLTGLYNRSALLERLVKAMERQRHSETNEMIAVLYLDLDGFKPVNDAYGHAVGDWVLIEVARRLRASTRDQDVVARVGGDEFIIVLQNIVAPAIVDSIAKKIIAAINQPFRLESGTLQIGASIGIALFPAHSRDAAQLIEYADRAMFQAKADGKNTFVSWQEPLLLI